MIRDVEGLIKVMNELPEIIQRFLVRDIQVILDKYKRIEKSESEKVEKLLERIDNQEIRDDLFKDWNKCLTLANEFQNTDVNNIIVSIYQWIRSNINFDTTVKQVLEYHNDLERYGYVVIEDNHLIYKKETDLEWFAKERLDEMLEIEHYVDKLLTKDELIEYWMNRTSKDEVVSELVSGVEVEELLGMNPVLIVEEDGEEYLYSEIDG